MQLKGKHYYGFASAVAGATAVVFALVYWFINQKLDSTVQVAFAAGLIGVALFAWLEIDLLTRVLNSRQARYGAEAAVMAAVFLGVIVLLNYIFTQDRLKKRWDLTEAKEHTLAPETLKTLSALTEPVKAVGFYTSQAATSRQNAENLLNDYKANSGGKFDFEFIDPQLKPTLAQEYGVARDGTLYVEMGTRREQVDFADESSLTSAVVRLTHPTVRVVYFMSGHGERSLDDGSDVGISQLKRELESVNYQVKTLNVITQTIPSDASVVVIAGPTSPYTEPEVNAIANYLASGGKAVMLIEPAPLMNMKPGDKDPLVEYLSSAWGLTLRDDIVIDPAQYVAQFGATVPATVTYGYSPITKNLKNVVSFFPSARSIDVADASQAPGGVTDTSIIRTSPNAWGETNFDSINSGQPQQDQSEASGELTLAATAENSNSKARLAVFGDSQFAINGFSRGANGTIFINAVKWASADDQLIGLTPKESITRTLNVYTNRDLAIVFLLSCILPPLVVLLAGIGVWWSRRQHA